VRVGLPALVVPVALGFFVGPLWAQLQSTKSAAVGGRPAFEEASVKPNHSIDPRGYNTLRRPGGHVAIANATLRQLIGLAYHSGGSFSAARNQIVQMPHWGDSERFDIEAESPGNPPLDQKRLMLQSLLAERFKLVVHHETRQRPVYALVLAKPGRLGPQLQRRTGDEACPPFSGPGTAVHSTGSGEAPPRSSADAARALLRQSPCGRTVGGVLQQEGPNPEWAGGRKVTMATIAGSLGGDEYIDRPVVDRTGLSGNFDFTMEWNAKHEDLSVNPQSDVPGTSLFEALREQLGLKVKAEKGPVEVLVIDHVEHPSPN
jgi:uncharacterized protein (TIGR03435 family)